MKLGVRAAHGKENEKDMGLALNAFKLTLMVKKG